MHGSIRSLRLELITYLGTQVRGLSKITPNGTLNISLESIQSSAHIVLSVPPVQYGHLPSNDMLGTEGARRHPLYESGVSRSRRL
jgi:hypothetical protein